LKFDIFFFLLHMLGKLMGHNTVCFILTGYPTNFNFTHIIVALAWVDIRIIFFSYIFLNVIVLEMGKCWWSFLSLSWILRHHTISFDYHIEFTLNWCIAGIKRIGNLLIMNLLLMLFVLNRHSRLLLLRLLITIVMTINQLVSLLFAIAIK